MRSKGKGYKRKQYLINKDFQIHLLTWVFLMSMAVMGSIALTWFSFNMLSENTAGPPGEVLLSKPMFALTNPVSIVAILVLWFLLAFLVWICFRMTHSIAGPIYRFSQVANAISEGDYSQPPINLRDGDKFGNLAGDINQMIDSLKDRRDKHLAAAEVMAENLKAFEEALGSQENPDKEQSGQFIIRMKESCAELQKIPG